MAEDFVRPGAVRVKSPEQREAEKRARLDRYADNNFARASVAELDDEHTRQDRLERIAALPVQRKPAIITALSEADGYSDLPDEVRAQVTEALKS